MGTVNPQICVACLENPKQDPELVTLETVHSDGCHRIYWLDSLAYWLDLDETPVSTIFARATHAIRAIEGYLFASRRIAKRWEWNTAADRGEYRARAAETLERIETAREILELDEEV